MRLGYQSAPNSFLLCDFHLFGPLLCFICQIVVSMSFVCLYFISIIVVDGIYWWCTVSTAPTVKIVVINHGGI